MTENKDDWRETFKMLKRVEDSSKDVEPYSPRKDMLQAIFVNIVWGLLFIVIMAAISRLIFH